MKDNEAYKALSEFVLKMKPNSYWKLVLEDVKYFVKFKAPKANFEKGSIEGWTRAIIIDHSQETIYRDIPCSFYNDPGYFYTGGSSNIRWTESTEEMFKFWWNLAEDDYRW